MFKVNNKNIRTRQEICSKLTIKTPERRIVNFEQVNDDWAFSLSPENIKKNKFSDVLRGYITRPEA